MGQTDSESEVRTRLQRILTRDDHLLCVAVAEHNSAVVGYAWAQDYGFHLRSGRSIARLNDIYVAPKHRRSGIGTQLIMAGTAWTIERGVTWLQWQSSAEALPFYRCLGLVGDPCPDPNHPFYEIDFSREDWREKLTRR